MFFWFILTPLPSPDIRKTTDEVRDSRILAIDKTQAKNMKHKNTCVWMKIGTENGFDQSGQNNRNGRRIRNAIQLL